MKKATPPRWLAAGCCVLLSCACLMAGETNRDEAAPGLPSRPAPKEKTRKPAAEFPFKPFYLDVSVGYGFDMGGIPLSYRGGPPEKFYHTPCSLGEGLRIGLNFGYRFNRNLALEAAGSFMALVNTGNYGSYSVFRQNDSLPLPDDYDYLYPPTKHAFNDDRSLQNMQVGKISLHLVASPGFARWDPYVKAGVSFIMTRFDAQQTISILNNSYQIPFYEATYTQTLRQYRFGFSGAIGVNWHLSETISLFAEWTFSLYNPCTLSWTRGELVSCTGDQSQMADHNISVAREVDSDLVSFSSHGINLGLKIKF